MVEARNFYRTCIFLFYWELIYIMTAGESSTYNYQTVDAKAWVWHCMVLM